LGIFGDIGTFGNIGTVSILAKDREIAKVFPAILGRPVLLTVKINQI
jgi:hypothetical protein